MSDFTRHVGLHLLGIRLMLHTEKRYQRSKDHFEYTEYKGCMCAKSKFFGTYVRLYPIQETDSNA